MSASPPGGDRRVVRRLSIAEDVDKEIRAHVQMRADELVAAGWEASAAREEAARLFGDADRIAEECARIARRRDRVERRALMLGSFLQDLSYGARALARAPGFTVVAVVTLGLGIGANAGVFSVVNGVLLRPLPYDDPENIAFVGERRADGGSMAVAWANFVDWHSGTSSFESLAAYGSGSTTVLGGERPVSSQVASVSRDFWSVFGVEPARGRFTLPADHVEGAEPALVVSERFWRNELAGAELAGVVLEVQGSRARVVGVAPLGFDFPAGTDVWLASELFPQSSSRTAHNWRVVGRLADGVALERAGQEIDALTRRLVTLEPDADPDFLAAGATIETLQARLVGDSTRPLMMLLGAAGLVLLVACTNLASTLLARGSTRSRELAVRLALGAGRGRIARQLLTESLLLAAAGAVAGLVVAVAVVSALRSLDPTMVPRLEEVGVDGWVLAYTAAIAVLTALLFGLLPVARLTRSDAAVELRAGTRGNAAEHRALVWGALVATEVALALVLLVGAGLLVRSFRALLSEDAGFDARDVIAAEIALSRIKYETAQAHADWYGEFIRELEALPGVAAAGVLSTAPVSGGAPNGRLELDGDLESRAVGEYVVASAGAFAALDVPLLRGRLFDERDRSDQPHVAIVSESFAEQYWAGQDPIGSSVTGGGMDDLWQERRFAEVVGVVGDVRFRSLDREPVPVVYFPYSQRPFRIRFGATVVVESATGDPATVAPGVRATLQRLDSDVPVLVSPLEAMVGASLADRRFAVLLLGGFSLIALVLAGVGIYGVVSYAVARRTREMGIRLALGADGGRVLTLVMIQSLRNVLAGLLLGLLGTWALARVTRSLLYGVEPGDPPTLSLVVALLGGVGVLATWIPARAGTKVDPMVTMRAE